MFHIKSSVGFWAGGGRNNSDLELFNALHLTFKIKEQLFLGQDKMAKNDAHMFVGLKTPGGMAIFLVLSFRR